MPKLSKQETELRRQQARDLYVKGFDCSTIADLLNMSVTTINKWADLLNFEQAKKARSITLSEMRETILDSFQKLKAGEKPSISPDAAAKYAKAFEQLSDHKRCLPHFFEAFEVLTDRLTLLVQNASSKAEREFNLSCLKHVREESNKILTEITNESINN
ncbi:MAG: hypothetical protein KBT03_10015 [Bacteroidales bacterium]|nr:hypothetical protein [Candidatus Scybalousia scybalohippi]